MIYEVRLLFFEVVIYFSYIVQGVLFQGIILGFYLEWILSLGIMVQLQFVCFLKDFVLELGFQDSYVERFRIFKRQSLVKENEDI